MRSLPDPVQLVEDYFRTKDQALFATSIADPGLVEQYKAEIIGLKRKKVPNDHP